MGAMLPGFLQGLSGGGATQHNNTADNVLCNLMFPDCMSCATFCFQAFRHLQSWDLMEGLEQQAATFERQEWSKSDRNSKTDSFIFAQTDRQTDRHDAESESIWPRSTLNHVKTQILSSQLPAGTWMNTDR
jgi:hypothetical protein